MKKHFSLFILIFSLISCKTDLNGHWHSVGFDNYDYALDIENDSLYFMISSLSSEPNNGKHNVNNKKVEIYGDNCGVYDFTYEVKNNDIYA